MSIQSDIAAALSAIARGRVYPQAAPAETASPYVVWRRLASEETHTIHGELVCTRSVFSFECWGETLLDALVLADEVRAAIRASALESFPAEQNPGDEYDQQTDSSMEPVTIGFWH